MESGHYGIDLGRTEEILNCYIVDEKFHEDNNYQRKEIKKIHQRMGHPGADKLISIYKFNPTSSGKHQPMLLKLSSLQKTLQEAAKTESGTPKSNRSK